MKKCLFVLLISTILLFLVACGGFGGDDDTVKPLTSKTLTASDLGNYTDWFPIDKNTVIEISDVKDDELFVITTKTLSPNHKGAISRDPSENKGGLNKSETGKNIIRTDEGEAKFAGKGLGVSKGVYMTRVERVPMITVKEDNYKDIRVGVFDYEGKGNERITLSYHDTFYDYYVSEKVLHIKLEDIRKTAPDALKKCAIIRQFQYHDSNYAEDEDFGGIHNTRNTYGFLLKNESGEYIVKSSGVCDLSGLSFVNVYTSHASNIISGSGMYINVVPVTSVSVASKTDIKDRDVAFGCENLDGKDYVLKITNLNSNYEINSFSLQDTATEIRDYVEGKLQPRGYILSYDQNSEAFYYRLGKINKNVYIDNHLRHGDPLSSGETYYSAELVYASETDIVEHAGLPDKMVFEINTTGTDLLTGSNGVVTYTKVVDRLDEAWGRLSIYINNINRAMSQAYYRVSFWEYDEGQWKTREYDNNSLQGYIGYSSTGNKLLTDNISTDEGTIVLACEYSNIQKPVRMVVEFSNTKFRND